MKKLLRATKNRIWVTFDREGIHNYPGAMLSPDLATNDWYDVSFLGHPHRHMFHFRVEIDVFHQDRDIEFIQFKRWLEQCVWHGSGGYAPDKLGCHLLQFGARSCEMIADDLAGMIHARYPDRTFAISVAEDNENGCIKEYVLDEVIG